MKLSMVVIACILFSSTVFASSGAPTCARLYAYKSYEQYSGVVPKNFALVPPCPDLSAPPDGLFVYDYLFVGDAIITGRIHFDEEEMMENAYFEADKQSQTLLPSWTSHFKLDHGETPGIETFHLPELKGCFTASASIRVIQIELRDDGTDASGSYLKDYTIVSVGKYLSCKSKADSE